MPTAYTPSAPYGTGTDDYRCFVLDPHLHQDAFITGLNILPGQPKVVHHVILFRVPPSSVPAAEAKDAAEKGEGWTCFGGTGLESVRRVPRRRALARRLGTRRLRAGDGQGRRRPAGEGVAGDHAGALQPARRTAPGRLLGPAAAGAGDRASWPRSRRCCCPRPVELPCRPGPRPVAALRPDDRRGRRAAAVRGRRRADRQLPAPAVRAGAGRARCRPATGRCTEPATIRAAAGHMHLLGRSIKIEVDPGTPARPDRARHPGLGLRQPGRQGRQAGRAAPGDTVRVTCRHDQSLRDLLPAFKGQPERYVVWGEGTTDEMCLGHPARHPPLRSGQLEPELGDQPGGDRDAASPRRRSCGRACRSPATRRPRSSRRCRSSGRCPSAARPSGNGLRAQEVLGLDELDPGVVGVLRLVVLLHAGTLARGPGRGPPGNALARGRGRLP